MIVHSDTSSLPYLHTAADDAAGDDSLRDDFVVEQIADVVSLTCNSEEVATHSLARCYLDWEQM